MRKNKWLVLGMFVAGTATVNFARSQATPAWSSAEVKIKTIMTCYELQPSMGGGNGWFPTIIIKFTPKIPLSYFDIKGNFVNLSTNEPIGQMWENDNELESGLNYTYKASASTGFSTPKNHKVRFTPKLMLSRDGQISSTYYTLPTITNFSSKICS